MGYLITAHVFLAQPNVASLDQLPKSIGYRVYLHRATNLYLLDTFRASKVPRYPFQTLLPTADIPLELPPGLETLEQLYTRLGPLNLANGFKKSYVNAALLLNRLLDVPVFSFASNDDDLDFTSFVSAGILSRLKCRCGDLLITYDQREIQVAPLVPATEEDDDEDLLTETDSLNVGLPGVTVLPRKTPWNSQLHWIAREELQAFGSIKEPILGLGSFDPPEIETECELVALR